MVMQVGMVTYFLGLVLVLWEQVVWRRIGLRSEEHTSELQSPA